MPCLGSAAQSTYWRDIPSGCVKPLKWGPHKSPAKRVSWGEEGQRNDRAFAIGGSEGYEACPDDETYPHGCGYGLFFYCPAYPQNKKG